LIKEIIEATIMTHFGMICPGTSGHLNTMFPLGKELQQRGHRVTLFTTPSIQPKALAAGLDFLMFGESEFSVEKTREFFYQLGKLDGLKAVRFTMDILKMKAFVSLRDIPSLAKEAGVEALLVDQLSSEGGTIADFLNIPFISVCSAVVFNQEDTVPPFFKTWNNNSALWARLRNRAGYSLFNRIRKPIREVISEYRQRWNLRQYSGENDYFSKLAIISQQPAEFEFPRQNLPECFHFTGSYHNSTGRPSIDFPFDKLTGKPLIYASLGTLQNRLQYIFQYIAEACLGLDAQLVISLGGALEPEAMANLPGVPLVVKYAPQLELLKKASLVITHAGLNTTLESLSEGVPMVAIPITNDQPGVAARIAWCGAGEMLSLPRLSAAKLQEAIKKVLTEESYKQNAVRLQEAIHRAGGVSRAIDIVEKAVAL
jgi:zeaxanthin glucosyltransferase